MGRRAAKDVAAQFLKLGQSIQFLFSTYCTEKPTETSEEDHIPPLPALLPLAAFMERHVTVLAPGRVKTCRSHNRRSLGPPAFLFAILGPDSTMFARVCRDTSKERFSPGQNIRPIKTSVVRASYEVDFSARGYPTALGVERNYGFIESTVCLCSRHRRVLPVQVQPM